MRKRSEAGEVRSEQIQTESGLDATAKALLGTRVPSGELATAARPFTPDDPRYEQEGTVVEVTWGEEQFQPVEFNTFRVGPFKATTHVRQGESPADAMLRLHRHLDAEARKIFVEKSAAYLRDLADVGARARQR